MSRIAQKSTLFVSPEPSRKIGRSELANAEIQNAAVEFLWSSPFREMTVDKLMKNTSLGRSAFYYHFSDIYDLMEAMLGRLESEVMAGASPWLTDEGDPVALLFASLSAEVEVCCALGPMLKAVTDAAGTDARLEAAWNEMMGRFDEAVSERIAADQALGLAEEFDPALVATALNNADVAIYVRSFGQKPRRPSGPVLDAIARVWISSIYGKQWVEHRSSTLYRKEG